MRGHEGRFRVQRRRRSQERAGSKFLEYKHTVTWTVAEALSRAARVCWKLPFPTDNSLFREKLARESPVLMDVLS